MGTIEHVVTVGLDAAPIQVLSGTVTIDATRAPRITAEITVPTSELPTDLDPRYDIAWASITATAATKHGLTLADLTEPAGTTLADLSARYAGQTLRQVPYTDTSRTWRLNLRTVTEQFADETTTLQLKSCEALLQDFTNPGGIIWPDWTVQWDVTLPGTSILDAVNKIVTLCRLPPVTIYPSSAATTAVDTALRSWVRGVSAWEKVLQLARTINAFPEPDEATGGLRLRADNDRYRPAILHTVASAGPSRRLKGGTATRDRDAPEFATVIAPISNLIPAGDTQARPLGASASSAVRHGLFAAMPWKVKTMTATASSADPGYAVPAAYNIANVQVFQAAGRGYEVEVVMTPDYTIDLLDVVDAVRPGRPTRRATVEAMTFAWPADELRVRGRRAEGGGSTRVQLTDWWIP
ncbi:MAG TPA: hypothetical protein VNQ48_00185 [Microbacteriaceae bacterium]|nr:hypothetical protein [Microbacteriaceae bacterium]